MKKTDNKKKLICLVAIFIIVSLCAWYIVSKTHREKIRPTSLGDLYSASDPITQTPTERLEEGKALEQSSKKITTTPESRLKMLDAIQ